MRFKKGDKVEFSKFCKDTSSFRGMEGKTGFVECHVDAGVCKVCVDGVYVFVDESWLIPASEYPKKMLVWNDDDADAVEREVVAYVSELEYPYLRCAKGLVNGYIGYKNAKDIKPQQIELTLDDIAKKYDVPVEQIKIKK